MAKKGNFLEVTPLQLPVGLAREWGYVLCTQDFLRDFAVALVVTPSSAELYGWEQTWLWL